MGIGALYNQSLSVGVGSGQELPAADVPFGQPTVSA